MQSTSHLFQPCERHFAALAYILLEQLLPRSHIGIPVRIALSDGVLACGVGSCFTLKGEGGGLVQPGKPGRAFWHEVKHLVIGSPSKQVALLSSRPGQEIGCGFRHTRALCETITDSVTYGCVTYMC